MCISGHETKMYYKNVKRKARENGIKMFSQVIDGTYIFFKFIIQELSLNPAYCS